jgi:hypothetical protein
MSQETSSYDIFDLLNQQAAQSSGGQTPAGSPSRLTSALNSINQFLDTATNTIVTVDEVINRPKESSGYQDEQPGQLFAGQHAARPGQLPALFKYLVIAGVAVGGSTLAYRTLKK